MSRCLYIFSGKMILPSEPIRLDKMMGLGSLPHRSLGPITHFSNYFPHLISLLFGRVGCPNGIAAPATTSLVVCLMFRMVCGDFESNVGASSLVAKPHEMGERNHGAYLRLAMLRILIHTKCL